VAPGLNSTLQNIYLLKKHFRKGMFARVQLRFGKSRRDCSPTASGLTEVSLYPGFRSSFSIVALTFFLTAGASRAQDESNSVTVHWDKIDRVSKTTATLQVVVNPPLRRGSPIHDKVFSSLRDLQADYVRYVPWLPYPRLGVAELESPKDGKSSWDFSVIDPMTIDFLEATKGHSVVLNFSTIPQWMFKTDHPVSYPSDPDQVFWDYEQGRELRDPSAKEVADYFARLLSWYTQGGLTDEFGKRHESGHHLAIPYWEILNEPDSEHQTSPENYTRLYDQTVLSMRKVQPNLKFVGVSMALPSQHPEFFEYFLNPRNHQPGVPLDYISYHFYATPGADESQEVQQFTFFAQAEGFLNTVGYIEAIRKRLSPSTGTMINELGAIAAQDSGQATPGHVTEPIPNSYWNLAGAMFAYLFLELSRKGIDVVGESQLVGYPTQYPTVSMLDWKTGDPNPRYWVLKLLHDNFAAGDTLVDTQLDSPYVYASGAITKDGKKRVLLVNKRDRPVAIVVPGASRGQQTYVDVNTGFQPPVAAQLTSDKISLGPFSVCVVTLP